ncbi:MAG: hypothetical protein ACI87E_001284 [Mariniblastus sp.]|jgi:hypothetical protein
MSFKFVELRFNCGGVEAASETYNGASGNSEKIAIIPNPTGRQKVEMESRRPGTFPIQPVLSRFETPLLQKCVDLQRTESGFHHNDFDRVSANAMIQHRADRPEQTRGIPDITPTPPLFAQLRRFTLAVLAAAFAWFLYTDAPANGEADAAEPFQPIELEKRMFLV